MRFMLTLRVPRPLKKPTPEPRRVFSELRLLCLLGSAEGQCFEPRRRWLRRLKYEAASSGEMPRCAAPTLAA